MFGPSNTSVRLLPESQVLAHRLFSLVVTGWGNGQYLSQGVFGLGGFMWSIGVWLSECKEQEGRVLVMQDFC